MKYNQTFHTSCPYLGLSYDRVTYSNFPSINNVCYHVNPVSTPVLSHQHTFCLTNKYYECSVYQSPEGSKFPQELQQQQDKKTNKWLLMIVGFCIVVILSILLYLYWNNIKAITVSPSQTPTENQTLASPELRSTNTRAATITSALTSAEPSATPTMQVTATLATLAPSQTPTEVRLFSLDQVIGENPQFIIHRTLEGESLPLYANIYETSVEAIRSVNYNLPRVLWTGQIVIIPINQTDMSGIPQFIAYEVTVNSITFDQIAEDFSVSVENLLRYNNVSAQYPLSRGDWILIPQSENLP